MSVILMEKYKRTPTPVYRCDCCKRVICTIEELREENPRAVVDEMVKGMCDDCQEDGCGDDFPDDYFPDD
jgi:hypothetical protein